MSNTDVARVLERYKQAVLDKDLEAFISMYDPKVRVFDAWGHWACEGLDGWRRMVRAWFDSLGDERITVASEGVQVAVDGDLATLHGAIIYTAIASNGAKLRSMRNRLTWVLRRGDGMWKLVHEHTSVPLDFETKAMLADR
ncbi:MAG TPA: SgcJ/EcaC family oxidoreductase [Usitatibacter sp.]|nr:SgcJ/EcaC family oxidoreductase [Usitatibacter sp.]